MRLSCVIVDDNNRGISVLSNLLRQYFKEIEILGSANSVDEAVNLINKEDPDIVFLDIEMPGQNGTALFDHILDPTFDTIFTTAFPDFAAQAFRLGSTDYLLKPIKPTELKEAIDKVKLRRENKKDESQSIKSDQSEKITFSAVDSIEIVTISDILYCKAENNYTQVFTKRKKLIISKTLGHYESILIPYGFMRLDRSHLVNLSYIEQIDKSSLEVQLTDQSRIPFSGRRKKELLDYLSSLNG